MTGRTAVNVNVEKIMEEIRRDIRMEEDLKNLPKFEDIPVGERRDVPPQGQTAAPADAYPEDRTDWALLAESTDYVNRHYDIPYYWAFSGSRAKVFFKRVVRKLAKCLLAPIVSLQNGFNTHVVRCLNNLRETVLWLAPRSRQFEREIAELKNESAALRNESAALRDELERGQRDELAALRDEIKLWLDTQETEMAGLRDEIKLWLDAQETAIAGLRDEIKLWLDAQETEIAGLRSEISDETAINMEAQLSTVTALQDDMSRRIDEMAQREDAFSGELLANQQILSDIRAMMNTLDAKITALDRQSDAFSASVAKTILKYSTGTVAPETTANLETENEKSAGHGDIYKVLDYFKFQNDFRGTRSVIAQGQEIYLPYFRDRSAPIIDIGCGRGEFLRLLKDNNIPGYGVDLYPEYVIEGELNGVDVRQGDGIEALKNADIKFGGIFSAQVIEHINFEQLQELCAAAYEKLLPDSYLILETQNPTCVSMFTSTFYVDPTHNKPIHPLLLEYLLREVGFREVRTLYTDTSRAGSSLPKIQSSEIKNIDEVNAAIERVSNFLYGSLDYAVIAKK